MNRLFRSLVAGVAFFGLMGTALASDSSSYVQNGLIAQWDGIDNVGTGVHDPNATSWKNLKGDGTYDFTLLSKGKWGDAWLDVTGPAAKGTVAAPLYKTVEIVFRETKAIWETIIFYSANMTGTGANNRSPRWVLVDNYGKNCYFDGAKKTICTSYTFDAEADRMVAGVYDDNHTVTNIYSDGVALVNPATLQDGWNAPTSYMMLGARLNAGDQYNFEGRIYAIRLYDRALTPEEIAKNHKIDNRRFFGVVGGDALDVTGSPSELAVGVMPAYGSYEDMSEGDKVTLTAPSGEITSIEGHKVVCTGYKIYDAEGTVVASGDELTYEYTHPGGYRRFEWQFRDYCKATVVGEGGSYDPSEAWVLNGDTFTFTITPNEGKGLKLVSNSVDSETWTTPTVAKKITVPTVFTATYSSAYYVDPENGNDENAGNTHATPLATIEKAVEKTVAGDTVYLMAGEYAQPDATITLDKAIFIKGEEGADKTFVKLSANRTVFAIAAAGAYVGGITFYGTDWTTAVGSPIWITAAATAENCNIRDAFIAQSPVYVQYGGTVRNIHVRHVKGNGNYLTGFELNSSNDLAENCSVIACEGNHGTYGCAVYLWNGTMRNCLIACNTNKSTQTAAAYVKGVSTLENCTIVDNVCLGSPTRAGVVMDSVYASTIVRNCLIVGNRNTSCELNWSGDETKFAHNCIAETLPGGEGNILAVNPDFTNRAGGDYTLKSGNAIDAGVSAAWQATSTDLAGNPRVIGEAVDMGCYEYVPGALAASAVPSVLSREGAGDITLQASAAGTNLIGVTYTWTIKNDNGETVLTDTTSGATFTHHYDYGRYTVTLDVKNAAGETATWTAEKAFSVISKTVYVATDSTPVYPYATKATAANDLAAALEAAVDGSTIVVCDGEYTVASGIVLLKNVTITSENGPDKATLVTTTKGIKLFTLSADGARVENLTLRSDGVARSNMAAEITAGTLSGCVVSNFNSNAADMEIILMGGATATVTNCLVTANRTTGRINTIDITTGGGLVTHSRIIGNVNDNNYYGSAVQFYRGVGTVRNCLIACNTNLSTAASAVGWTGGGAGCLVENCTIVGNHIAGGSVNSAVNVNANVTVRNCVIVDNTNSGGAANWNGTDANITYTCTDPKPAHESNVVASGTLFADDEYRPRSGVLVDAGLNQDWMTNGFDLDGKARLFEGGIVDLGCYEYVPGALECSVSPSTTMRLGEGEIVLTATVSSKSADLVYTWLVTNSLGEVAVSVSGTGLAAITNDYGYGTYSVHLTVAQGESKAVFNESDLFGVKPTTVYLAKNSTPTFPYNTRETAFTEYDDAIAFTESGMKVIVGDGTYTNAAHATISKDVTVVSENGADRTKIFAVNTSDCWTLNSAGAVMKGFTLFSDGDIFNDPTYELKHKAERSPHGVVVLQGALADCVVTNWFVYYEPLMIVGGTPTSAVVTNCLITGNRTLWRTYFATIKANSLITHCRIVNNVCDTTAAAYGTILELEGDCTIRSTLVADNRSIRATDNTNFGSVLHVFNYNVLVDSCTFVYNTSTSSNSPAIYCTQPEAAQKLTVRNSIIWGNANATGVLDWLTYPAPFVNCCCSTAGLPDGNLTDDPKLYLRGTSVHPLYSLKTDSPCVDAAVEQPWMTGATDLKGNARIIGDGPDIGAYECLPAQGLILLLK